MKPVSKKLSSKPLLGVKIVRAFKVLLLFDCRCVDICLIQLVVVIVVVVVIMTNIYLYNNSNNPLISCNKN